MVNVDAAATIIIRRVCGWTVSKCAGSYRWWWAWHIQTTTGIGCSATILKCCVGKGVRVWSRDTRCSCAIGSGSCCAHCVDERGSESGGNWPWGIASTYATNEWWIGTFKWRECLTCGSGDEVGIKGVFTVEHASAGEYAAINNRPFVDGVRLRRLPRRYIIKSAIIHTLNISHTSWKKCGFCMRYYDVRECGGCYVNNWKWKHFLLIVKWCCCKRRYGQRCKWRMEVEGKKGDASINTEGNVWRWYRQIMLTIINVQRGKMLGIHKEMGRSVSKAKKLKSCTWIL